VFCAGLAAASVIPAKATPNTLNSMGGTIVAQSGQFTNSSLRALATCLSNSGFTTVYEVSTSESVANNSKQNQNYIEGVVKVDNCLNLREEGSIETKARCMPSGEVVQVQLKDGSPITRKYGQDEFVFVISYKGDKGWAAKEYLSY
jgi:hypothetical protein